MGSAQATALADTMPRMHHRVEALQVAKHFGWFEKWRQSPLRCEQCGWEGPLNSRTMGTYRDLQDFECPSCEKILAIVAYPTDDEIRNAAAAGNQEAAGELTSLMARDEREERFTASKLSRPDQLPDLEGDVLEFAWDFEEEDDEAWVIIRCGERTIWQELAHWEDIPRFNEVKDLLRSKYGTRFRSMKPTPAAKLYLFGDNISAGVEFS